MTGPNGGTLVSPETQLVPICQTAEMLIARIPSNKANGFCIHITGNLFTKRNMESVIAEVVDCFLGMEK